MVKKRNVVERAIDTAVEKVKSFVGLGTDYYEGPSSFKLLGTESATGAPAIQIKNDSGFYEVGGKKSKIRMGDYAAPSDFEALTRVLETNSDKDDNGRIKPIQTSDGYPTIDGGITCLRIPDPRDPERTINLTVKQLISKEVAIVVDDVLVDFGAFKHGVDLTSQQKEVLVRMKIQEKLADAQTKYGDKFFELDENKQKSVLSFGYNVDNSAIGKTMVAAVKSGDGKRIAEAEKLYTTANHEFNKGLDNRRKQFEAPLALGQVDKVIANVGKYKGDEIKKLATDVGQGQLAFVAAQARYEADRLAALEGGKQDPHSVVAITKPDTKADSKTDVAATKPAEDKKADHKIEVASTKPSVLPVPPTAEKPAAPAVKVPVHEDIRPAIAMVEVGGKKVDLKEGIADVTPMTKRNASRQDTDDITKINMFLKVYTGQEIAESDMKKYNPAAVAKFQELAGISDDGDFGRKTKIKALEVMDGKLKLAVNDAAEGLRHSKTTASTETVKDGTTVSSATVADAPKLQTDKAIHKA